MKKVVKNIAEMKVRVILGYMNFNRQQSPGQKRKTSNIKKARRNYFIISSKNQTS